MAHAWDFFLLTWILEIKPAISLKTLVYFSIFWACSRGKCSSGWPRQALGCGSIPTFLLAACSTLLLQQALAVQSGQCSCRVLLNSWVGLGEGVHGASRAIRQACGAKSSIQSRHTWEHLSNFTKNPTIEKRNSTYSLVLSKGSQRIIWHSTTASACS